MGMHICVELVTVVYTIFGAKFSTVSSPAHKLVNMKVFINNADGYFENVLCEFLNKKDSELIGTSTVDSAECPQYIARHLKKDMNVLKKALLEADVIVYTLTDSIEEAKFAIKILESAQYNNHKVFILISSVISWATIKKNYIEEEEEEKEEEVPEEEEDSEEKENDSINNNELDSEMQKQVPKKRKDFEPLTEDMVVNRRPHVHYKSFIEIEKRVKMANCSTLKTFVVFSGIMYGRGEDKWHQFYKLAWMGDVPRLPCFLDGANYLPLIHVDDLATICTRIIKGVFPEEDEAPEEIEQYMLAVDSSQLKLKEILLAISKIFHGTQELEHIPEEQLQNYESTDYLTLDLKFSMDSTVVSGLDIGWKYQEGMIHHLKKLRKEYEKKRNLSPLKLTLLGPPLSGKTVLAKNLAKHYKTAYLNISDIIQEYLEREEKWENELFKLDEARILREREYERKVKERQDLIKQKLNEREKLAQEKLMEIKRKRQEERVREKEEERRMKEEKENEEDNENNQVEEKEEENEPDDDEELIAQIREEMGEFDEEEEGIPPEPEPLEEEELDENDPKSILRKKIQSSKKVTSLKDDKGRFTDKALTAMVKFKLAQRICKNQGWVMDGYPKSVAQAKLLMTLKTSGDEDDENENEEPENEQEDQEAEEEQEENKEEAEQEEDERTKGVLANPDTMPEYVVKLNVTDDVLENRFISHTDAGMKINEVRLRRRMEEYKKHNSGDNTVIGCLEGLITRNRNQPIAKEIDIATEITTDSLVQNILDFVGEPHNYGPSKEELEAIAKAEEERRRLEEERIERERLERIERERSEAQERELTRKRDMERLEEIRQQEKEMLEIKSQPIRDFLMDNIIPALSKGLVEIVQVKPEDPVDYLAQYLFNVANGFNQE